MVTQEKDAYSYMHPTQHTVPRSSGSGQIRERRRLWLVSPVKTEVSVLHWALVALAPERL